jgi:hypothetical protein
MDTVNARNRFIGYRRHLHVQRQEKSALLVYYPYVSRSMLSNIFSCGVCHFRQFSKVEYLASQEALCRLG